MYTDPLTAKILASSKSAITAGGRPTNKDIEETRSRVLSVRGSIKDAPMRLSLASRRFVCDMTIIRLDGPQLTVADDQNHEFVDKKPAKPARYGKEMTTRMRYKAYAKGNCSCVAATSGAILRAFQSGRVALTPISLVFLPERVPSEIPWLLRYVRLRVITAASVDSKIRG